MDIYHSKEVNGRFENAEKILISTNSKAGMCTPYISPKGDYLLLASIKMVDGQTPKKLCSKINNIGHGNPYVTSDNKFLFFTTGDHLKNNWKVKWVNIESELKNN